MQDLRLIAVPGGSGAVGVEHDGPAHLVNRHLMVERAEQDAVLDAGLAAVRLVGDMVHLAGRGGLVAAAGPPAMLVPQDDRAADRGRDVLADPDVQRQARPAEPGTQLPAPQEARQAARTRDQVDRFADDGLLEGLPGAGGVLAGRGVGALRAGPPSCRLRCCRGGGARACRFGRRAGRGRPGRRGSLRRSRSGSSPRRRPSRRRRRRPATRRRRCRRPTRRHGAQPRRRGPARSTPPAAPNCRPAPSGRPGRYAPGP